MNQATLNADLLEQFVPGTMQSIEEFRRIFPDLSDKLIADVYGYAYRRPGLDLKTRHVATIAAIAAMGGCEEQLRFQLRAALNLGFTIAEVREIFIQVAVFAGNARAINAAQVFSNICAEIDCNAQ
jgi:4-carboxymuconolactone decarboxylase